MKNKEKARLERIKSRARFGPLRPGAGRNTRHKDKRAQEKHSPMNDWYEEDLNDAE